MRTDVALKPPGANPEGQRAGTPLDLWAVLDREFNFAVDLAASEDNARCERYLTRYDNSLGVEWYKLAPGRWLWLNPPFADIKPWVEKCAAEMKLGAKIALLVPASVDSNWYRDYVENFTERRWLNPRVKFIGHTSSFPKPLMLALYNRYASHYDRDSYQWQWKKETR